MPHTNPFAPDPANPYTSWSSQELENARGTWATPQAEQFDRPDAVRKASHVGEELSRRADVDRAVELWERLCAVPFVTGETQGEYLYSTRHLSPEGRGRTVGAVSRMPSREELEALVLSDGEETTYPTHDVTEPSGYHWTQDTSPWSGGLRLYPITLTLISCGDYHGSDVDAANNRTLARYAGVTVREPNTGGMSSVFNVSTTVVGEMSTFADDPETRDPRDVRTEALDALEFLVKTMEGLIDYALIDEQAHSEYLVELAEGAWSDHLESDTRDALADIARDTLDFPHGVTGLGVFDDAEDLIDALYAASGNRLPVPTSLDGDDAVRVAYFEFDENEWNAETATSVVNDRHEDAVKHVARTVFGWNVP
jgi:hypothetical protein